MRASLSRLIEVSRILNVHVEGLFDTKANTQRTVFSWSNLDDVVWRALPAKEMTMRRWFDVPRGTNPIERAKA